MHLVFQRGCFTPLVADIHFQPRTASLCMSSFDKIRINPGNYADGRKVWADEKGKKNFKNSDTLNPKP